MAQTFYISLGFVKKNKNNGKSDDHRESGDVSSFPDLLWFRPLTKPVLLQQLLKFLINIAPFANITVISIIIMNMNTGLTSL